MRQRAALPARHAEVRNRFTGDDTTSLATNADTLVTELATYRANVTDQINDVECESRSSSPSSAKKPATA
jgi:hypothetical protein